MGLANRKEIGYFEFGMTNKELAQSLIHLNSKLRAAEQKLMISTDTAIMGYYNHAQNELIYLHSILERTKF
ncbi:hypothetical protein ACFSMW_05105 [Virgibacillus halophilus]|uniref:Spo0E like sporulation regulatory protein n=1 Tax=Tigheibacillus halophilus TaxID=361280 RepID=A0ABU5CB77_9BACI|nr:hypothetical protein [Virgibacillus halophilus]